MWLDGDEIVDASLLWPTDNGPRVAPMSEEETLLLGNEPEPLKAQEATMFPLEAWRFTNLKNHMSSQTLQIHIPLHLWPLIPIVMGSKTPGDPGIVEDLSIHQPPIQSAPMTGS